MLKSIEGIYRDGRVEFLEKPPQEQSRVVVTFLPATGKIDLREHGIEAEQAADLRGRLKSFSEDWDRPEMDVYDED